MAVRTLSPFFGLHKEDFISIVDTNDMVPRLQEKRLLDDAESDSIARRVTEKERRIQLCDVLYNKDPWTLLECLREGSSRCHGYAQLAALLESFLCSHRPAEPSRCVETLQSRENSATTWSPTDTYFNVIHFIETSFLQCNVALKQVSDTLEAICMHDHMQVSLPSESLTSLYSIAVCLRERGLCHELDTDLLCKLLDSIPATKGLHAYVREYSDFWSGSCILDQDFSGIGRLLDQSLAYMHCDLLNLTLHDIFFLKDFLAHHFDVRRHCISLTGALSQQSNSHLVWQITAPVCRRFGISALERDLSILSIDKLELYLRRGEEVTSEVYYTSQGGMDTYATASDCQSGPSLDRQYLSLNKSKNDNLKKIPLYYKVHVPIHVYTCQCL